MSLELRLKIDKSEARLELVENKQVIDIEAAKYYHDLSGVLITILDKLLIRNNIDIKSLKSYKILGNLGSDSTSYKIAATFIEGLKVSC